MNSWFLVAEAVAADEAIVEAAYIGRDEVLGVPVNAYRLVVDAGAVAEHIPAFLGEFLGEDASAEADDELVEILSQLTDPILVDTYLAVDDAGRRAGWCRKSTWPHSWRRCSARSVRRTAPTWARCRSVGSITCWVPGIDTLALDDPSTVVEWPDPSLVISVPR